MDNLRSIKTLESIFKRLRDPQTGCPWDRVQTHESVKQCIIEETYEVIDALDSKDPKKMLEEFGDLLLQIMFHTEIEREQGHFTIEDVIQELAQKLIRRHPHVFTENIVANSAEEVGKIWEKVKSKEAKDNNQEVKHTLDKVPSSFPPFLKAYKYGSKCSKLGFDWNNADEALQKVEEELQEVKVEASKDQSTKKNIDALKDEVGDLLFAVIQYIRKLDFCPDEILEKACKKYKSRFDTLEDLASKPIETYTLDELEELWQKAKKLNKQAI